MVYTWTYTDCAGNSHDWTHTVTVDMPDFTMPDNTSETVDCVADIVIPTPPTETDNCVLELTPLPGIMPDPASCDGVMGCPWTSTVCPCKSHVWTHTVTVDMPDFTMPDNTS